jgi:hypothetical protein
VCGSWGKGCHFGDGRARPPREGEGGSSWFQTVAEERPSSMTTETGDGLATTSRDGYAQSEYYCALYSNCVV